MEDFIPARDFFGPSIQIDDRCTASYLRCGQWHSSKPPSPDNQNYLCFVVFAYYKQLYDVFLSLISDLFSESDVMVYADWFVQSDHSSLIAQGEYSGEVSLLALQDVLEECRALFEKSSFMRLSITDATAKNQFEIIFDEGHLLYCYSAHSSAARLHQLLHSLGIRKAKEVFFRPKVIKYFGEEYEHQFDIFCSRLSLARED